MWVSWALITGNSIGYKNGVLPIGIANPDEFRDPYWREILTTNNVRIFSFWKPQNRAGVEFRIFIKIKLIKIKEAK